MLLWYLGASLGSSKAQTHTFFCVFCFFCSQFAASLVGKAPHLVWFPGSLSVKPAILHPVFNPTQLSGLQLTPSPWNLSKELILPSLASPPLLDTDTQCWLQSRQPPPVLRFTVFPVPECTLPTALSLPPGVVTNNSCELSLFTIGCCELQCPQSSRVGPPSFTTLVKRTKQWPDINTNTKRNLLHRPIAKQTMFGLLLSIMLLANRNEF